MGNRIDTQNRLIAAARQIVIEEGMEATSLEHICKVAGFTRGAFYSNFASKDSLLAALAEEEYAGLIERLRATVDRWTSAGNEGGTPGTSDGEEESEVLLMESLLFEALDAIGVGKDLFLIHSEFQMRSIRDPEWAARFLDINLEFIDELGRTLVHILDAAGRQPTRSVRALTHGVIGIVMRASSIGAWRTKAVEVLGPGVDPNAPEIPVEEGSVKVSPAREIFEIVLEILYASSEPVR